MSPKRCPKSIFEGIDKGYVFATFELFKRISM